ncbi:LexA family transcriptional regulator [Pseudomonas nitroreducens]|uniref:LexA family transcriptional regulator n=1 Tax=Pseudomonas nitroreducens TaxID=46680 RepID=UPI003D2A96D0
MDMNQLRIEALKRLMGGLTQAEFANRHDLNASYISQLLSGTRNFGERAARNMEEKIGLPAGTLSRPDGDAIDGEFVRISGALQHFQNVEGVPMAVKGGLVPVVGMAQLGTDGYFEALDYPVGHGDGYIRISSDDPNAYALKVVGNSMEPRIRSGEFVIIEPNKPYVAGDEVLVRTTSGQSMIKVFMYARDGMIRLLSVNDAHPPLTIAETDIEKIHFMGAISKSTRYVEL